MMILEDLSGEVPDTNAFHWNLKQFSNDRNQKTALFYGYNSMLNSEYLHKTRNHEKRILFNNWAPCEFAQEFTHPNKRPIEYENTMNVVYSIDPFSVAWMNSLNLGRCYKDIFYPFCKTSISPAQEKKYEVIYHGGIHGVEHAKMIRTLLHFKTYRYCSMTCNINKLTYDHLPWSTNRNLSFQDKIKLVAQTKISICYNLVHVMPEQVTRIQSLNQTYGPQNDSFKMVGSWNVMPQFKTRMHEAAFSRTLNLVRRDSWNIAERYYEPEKEFLYFNSEEDLENRIGAILEGWNSTKIQNILEAAYKRSLNYTTDRFIQTIAANEDE